MQYARPVSLLLLSAFLLGRPVPLFADVYSYTDKQGNLHFVDSEAKIPPEYRKNTRTIEMPSRPAPPAPEPALVDPLPPENGSAPAPSENQGEETRPIERDSNGHDEKWWRSRKEKLERRKRELEEELEKFDEAALIVAQGFYSRSALHEREQKKERLRKELAGVNEKIVALREEARQAGAPPGWLR